MADYMDGTMASLIAPSQNVEKQLASGSEGFFKGAEQGMQTAVGLATVDDQVKQKKAQTEKMQDDLDTMKYNKTLGLMDSVARASLSNPKVGATVARQAKASAERSGLNIDPAIFDDIQSNEEARRQFRAAYATLTNLSSDPAARAQAQQVVTSFQSPSGQTWSESMNEFMKGSQTAQVEKMKADAGIKEAQIRADAIKNSGAGTARSDSLTERVNKAWDADPLIRPYVKAQDAIGRAYHTLDNPPEGITSTQLIKEVSNDIANSLQMGAASTGDDREKQEYKNISTDWARVQSYLSDHPADIDDAALVKYLKTNLKRIDESYKANIANRNKQLSQGRQGNFKSPNANTAVEAKMKAYSSRSGIDMSAPAGKPNDAYEAFHDSVKLDHPNYPESKIRAYWDAQQGGK